MPKWYTVNERFVNPYNFVRLDGCKKEPLAPPTDAHTGYISYTLTTRTPLLIPDASNRNALPKKGDLSDQTASYDFFSYDCEEPSDKWGIYAEPVIPGSALRGVIRSVFEAAYQGCMAHADLDAPFYRRTATQDAKSPGLLKKEDGTWKLYEAKKAMLLRRANDTNPEHGKLMSDAEYRTWEEGSTIYVRLRDEVYKTSRGFPTDCHVILDWSKTPKSGYEKGYLHKGQIFIRKHHESVLYIPDNQQRKEVRLATGAIERLKEVMAIYADKRINRTGRHYGKFNEDAEVIPVYYSADASGCAKYLSPACITKEVFENRLGNILPEEYHPCRQRESLCAACALFGYVGENESVGGRVRFTDARIKDKRSDNAEYYDPPVVLPTTSGPKPSTAEFYTNPPSANVNYWTYDYIGQRSTYLEPSEIAIRGRKFYWHGAYRPELYKDRPLLNLEARMRPVKTGTTFVGKIYFDGVTRKELSRIIWCLTLNASEKNGHKMGHGKPYGFGSVQISDCHVYERQLALTDDGIGYSLKEMNDFWTAMWEEKAPSGARKDILGITCLTPIFARLVSYPKGRVDEEANLNATAGHQWFSGNKDRMQFQQILPTIDEETASGSLRAHTYGMVRTNYRPQNAIGDPPTPWYAKKLRSGAQNAAPNTPQKVAETTDPSTMGTMDDLLKKFGSKHKRK